MFGFELTEYDKKVYEEQLRDFLPDKIIDIHTHVWKKEFKRIGRSKGGSSWPNRVAEDCTIEDLLQTYKDLFPGKTVIPNIFGMVRELDVMNNYIRESGQKYGLPYFYRIDYTTDPEKVERDVVEGGFKGFKPYPACVPEYLSNEEVRIYDFMTPEHLKIADKYGLCVMLHIGRSGRLRDKVNIAQIAEIDERFPNLKLIVAHVGRAYTEHDFGDAFEVLSKTKNIMFDFSANTYDTAIQRCIETVGPKRVLFGSDMPIAKMRMYRITEGANYVNVVPRGMYGDVSTDVHMRETDESNVTCFIYETLLAFKRASEKLGLTRDEINDILCKNAERILGI